MAQLVGCPPVKRKVTGSILSRGTCLACGFGPRRQPMFLSRIDVSSSSFSLLSSPLSKSKSFLRKKKNSKKWAKKPWTDTSSKIYVWKRITWKDAQHWKMITTMRHYYIPTRMLKIKMLDPTKRWHEVEQLGHAAGGECKMIQHLGKRFGRFLKFKHVSDI